MFLYHDNNPPREMNITVTAMPLKAESLYRLKKGIKKNVTVVIPDIHNVVHKTPG